MLSHLTEAQKQTFLIADNQIGANSTWDDKKLEITLQKLERNSSIWMLSDSVRRNSIGFWRTWSRRTWPETQRMFRTRPPWPSPSQAIYGYLGDTRYFAGIASWTATWNECWEAKGPA